MYPRRALLVDLADLLRGDAEQLGQLLCQFHRRQLLQVNGVVHCEERAGSSLSACTLPADTSTLSRVLVCRAAPRAGTPQPPGRAVHLLSSGLPALSASRAQAAKLSCDCSCSPVAALATWLQRAPSYKTWPSSMLDLHSCSPHP